MTRALDREGASGAALPGARGADRLDGGRGRHRATRPTRGWPRRACARWRGRAASSPRWSASAAARVRDRSRAMGRRLRAISRTIRRRTGEAKAEVLKLTARDRRAAGALGGRGAAAGREAQAPGRAAAARGPSCAPPPSWSELADRCEQVAAQIKQRVAGEPITDRLVSLADPDARPIRKGKLGKPNEFGYVTQIAEVTDNTTPRRARPDPAAGLAPGNPSEDTLLPQTVAELARLGLSPREVALDGGFNSRPDRPGARAARARAGLHRRPPTARLQAHPATPAALPHRRRGPHQPPQTRLRAASQPAQGRRRPADLDRLGDPRLQPRHARRPQRLKPSKRSTPEQPTHPRNGRATTPARPFQRSAVYPGQVASAHRPSLRNPGRVAGQGKNRIPDRPGSYGTDPAQPRWLTVLALRAFL